MIKYQDIRFGIFQMLLLGLFSSNDTTTIVQIGAHDGKHYDGLFDILETFKPKTKIFLIEPQDSMKILLNQHYSWHSDYTIIKEVIMDGKKHTFYSIAPEYYKDYRYDFVDIKMPDYVNPTGISTCNYKTFKKHYDNYFFNKKVPFEEVIETKEVQTITLPDLLIKYNIKPNPQVLMIDAEGDDANILYNNDWNLWTPKIIIFEQMHLDSIEKTKVVNLLEQNKYVCLDLVEHIAALLIP
jgi:hypothetical protein